MILPIGTRVTAADGVTLPKIGDRITDKSAPPDDGAVREWIGPKAFGYWTELRNWIVEFYPGVFAPDWLYGGRNRGWSLRYKKTRAFCTLVPEYRLFSAVVVMGGAEREKFEERRYVWRPHLVKLYDEAKTYIDGKWLTVAISSADDLHDVAELLTLKRPPPSAVEVHKNAGFAARWLRGTRAAVSPTSHSNSTSRSSRKASSR